MKHFDLQLKEFGQQFNEQGKCLDSKFTVDNSILSNILELYKRRAAIEQCYADSLLKLTSNITQRNNLDSQKRSKWKNYSPVKILNSLLVSTEHTARAHKNLGDIYGKQMTQRIIDMQDDCARLTKRSSEILQHRHLEIMESLNKLFLEQKTYSKLFTDADECRRRADKVMDQLDREVVRCYEKKKEVEKNFKIKKLKDEYLEKLKTLKEKYYDCTVARNEYVIHLASFNESLQHFYSSELNTIVQCSQYGFHNNLTRLVMNHNSCEEALSMVHCSIRDLFSSTMDHIDVSNDIRVFVDAQNSVFAPKEQLRFVSAKDDNINDILRIEERIEKSLQEMYDKFDTRIKEMSKDLLDKDEKISRATKELNNLISQMDYDVVNYVCRQQSPLDTSIKERSMINSKENGGDLFYSTVQKKVKEPKLQAEINYFKIMEEYLDDQISIVRIRSKLKNIDCALHRPLDLNELFYTKRTEIHRQTAIMVGMKSKLFGGDLRKYSLESKEDVPLVVRSCIRLINLYGMKNIGVFRVPGSQFEVQLNKTQFELGCDPNSKLSGNSNDVNVAASLLKLYFRELDPPMFNEVMFAKIVDMYNRVKQNEAAIVVFMKEFVTTLHPSVYATLTYLLAFLDHLSEFSAENCMDILNLAIIFGPCIMPIPEDKSSQLFQYQAIINHVTKCLITHREEIFSKPSIGPHYQKDQRINLVSESNTSEPTSASDTNRSPFFSECSVDSISEERSRTSSVTSSINLNSRFSDDPSTIGVQKFSSFSEIYSAVLSEENKVNEIDSLSHTGFKRKDSDAISVDSSRGSETRDVIKKISLGSLNSDFELESRCQTDTNNSPLLEIPPEFADVQEKKSPDSIEFIDAAAEYLETTDDAGEGGRGSQGSTCVVKVRTVSRSMASPENTDGLDLFDDELVQTRHGLQQIEKLHVINQRNTVLFDSARLASKFISPLFLERQPHFVIDDLALSQTLVDGALDWPVDDTSGTAPPVPPRSE